MIKVDHDCVLLDVRGATKRFGAVRALKGVDISVAPGEVHVILGQNGAGKSTLIEMLAGVHLPDEGSITWNGEAVTISNPVAALELGIATMYQELDVVDGLTIAIGGNGEAARLAGLKVKRHNVYLYALAEMTAGIAAVMILGRTTAGTSTHGTLYELDAIAAVVVGGTLLIGGRGTIVGTVFGVLIFATLVNVFTHNNLNTSVQAVAKGVIIVLAVLLQQRFAARDKR
jgi:ribose/xylose/arabinose/galactoside ABC-type transport system permease subunit